MRRFSVLISPAILGAALVAGCDHYHHRSDHRARYYVEHVHRDGCGHFFWHGVWRDDPHPFDCARCDAEPAPAPERVRIESRPVAAAPPPTIVIEHVHGYGCSHYFWHGSWWGWPHPLGCCVPAPRVSIRVGPDPYCPPPIRIYPPRGRIHIHRGGGCR